MHRIIRSTGGVGCSVTAYGQTTAPAGMQSSQMRQRQAAFAQGLEIEGRRFVGSGDIKNELPSDPSASIEAVRAALRDINFTEDGRSMCSGKGRALLRAAIEPDMPWCTYTDGEATYLRVEPHPERTGEQRTMKCWVKITSQEQSVDFAGIVPDAAGVFDLVAAGVQKAESRLPSGDIQGEYLRGVDPSDNKAYLYTDGSGRPYAFVSLSHGAVSRLLLWDYDKQSVWPARFWAATINQTKLDAEKFVLNAAKPLNGELADYVLPKSKFTVSDERGPAVNQFSVDGSEKRRSIRDLLVAASPPAQDSVAIESALSTMKQPPAAGVRTRSILIVSITALSVLVVAVFVTRAAQRSASKSLFQN